MAWPRHVMQSVAIPAVTQVRASTDYQPNNDQWQIGDSSILTYSMGLAPSKDVSLSIIYDHLIVCTQLTVTVCVITTVVLRLVTSMLCHGIAASAVQGANTIAILCCRIFEQLVLSQIAKAIEVERLRLLRQLRHMQLF